MNPMLNFNVNVGRKLIVFGEGKVNLQKSPGRHFGWLYCVYLSKNVRKSGSSQILSRFGVKKIS